MKLIFFYVLMAISSILSGCASSQISSVKDSRYAPSNPYKVILLYIKNDYTQKFEDEKYSVQKLSKFSGTTFISGIEAFGGNTNVTVKELEDLIKKEGIQAILEVEITDTQVKSSSYSMPGYNTVYGSVGDQQVVMSVPVTNTYTNNYEYWTNKLTLLDVKSTMPVWRANVSTNGFAGDHKGMRGALVTKTLKELLKEGLIQK